MGIPSSLLHFTPQLLDLFFLNMSFGPIGRTISTLFNQVVQGQLMVVTPIVVVPICIYLAVALVDVSVKIVPLPTNLSLA